MLKTVTERLEKVVGCLSYVQAIEMHILSKYVTFLGHTVSEGVHTDLLKILPVIDWPQPRNSKQVRSILGLASYYWKFHRGFADIARPLHKTCEKNSKFAWTDECQVAFEKLKEALTSAPILSYPKVGCKFILDSDASGSAVGAVLSQEQDGQEHVIAYMSKSLNKHEQLYCVTRKELLAVVTSLRVFHSYLYGQEVLLRTDNAAVSWMRTLKTPTGQMARWLQELSTYNLIVTHRAGSKHNNADALSRKPCKVCLRQQEILSNESEDECDETITPAPTTSSDKHNVYATTRQQSSSKSKAELTANNYLLDGWTQSDIKQEQIQDTNIGQILLAVSEGRDRPEWSSISSGQASLKTLWRQWDRLHIHAGLLYRKWTDENCKDTHMQLVVPQNKIYQVLHYHHDIPSSAYLGIDKTLSKIRKAFYWPGMADTVKKLVINVQVESYLGRRIKLL